MSELSKKFDFKNIGMYKILFIVTFFCIVGIASADTITLKSGNIIEGKIVEKNNDFIKIETDIGIPTTYYLDEIARSALEDNVMLNEIDEQLYQDNLRQPRTVTQEQSIDNMRRWWGFPRERAESFMQDLDVLRLQTALREEFQAGRLTEKDYLDRLEGLLLEARERRNRNREQRNNGTNGTKKNGGG
ncbi:hypothetical protein IID62_10040 [candidate division KSB1 bacterium]|nr:hypothetical protein [candidate division KSB1 bacterium]